MVMLITWVIELYLNQLGDLRDTGLHGAGRYDEMQDEFRKFLNQSKVKVFFYDFFIIDKKVCLFDMIIENYSDSNENLIMKRKLNMFYSRICYVL